MSLFAITGALAITGAIQGTSCDKLNQELGLESLKTRRRYKRLGCMYKIVTEKVHQIT